MESEQLERQNQLLRDQKVSMLVHERVQVQLHQSRIENAHLKEHINNQNRAKLQAQVEHQKQIFDLKQKVDSKDKSIAKLKQVLDIQSKFISKIEEN